MKLTDLQNVYLYCIMYTHSAHEVGSSVEMRFYMLGSLELTLSRYLFKWYLYTKRNKTTRASLQRLI